ncbi:MAG: arylsulfatase [Bryobacteraceae bacterium]|nr:arylsulfatase [Bryobacteraceae bacterium]
MKLSRREAVKTGAGAALAPAILRGQRSMSRPNILFLMDDQHRGDCIGADGNPAVRTPNLDRIAAEGARFRCAYSTTPTCTPARSALLTGLSPWNHGMLHMVPMAVRYPFTKPQALRDAGYYTMGIGKMHYTPQRNLHGFHHVVLDESGRVQSPDFRSDYRAWFWSQAPHLDPDATGIGFNDYPAKPYALPENLHPTHWTGQTAVNFLKGYNRPEPFFLKVSFARPHSPYDPPARFFKRYADADIPEAAVGKWAAKYAPRSGPKDDIWHGDLGPRQVRSSRQGYYGSIEFIDEQIGRILEVLEQRGWLEETLILFTSDHGDMIGDHHLWRKSYGYQGSARIPMLIRWPEGLVPARRGQVLSQPVELRDILPTFLDAAGAAPKAKLDGASLLTLIRNSSAEWREYIDLEHGVCYSRENNWNGFTDGRMKYIYHAFHGEEQLFDLENDPKELNDLSGDPKAEPELRKWRQRLIEHLSIRGDQWVKNGRLQTRKEPIPRSPNFPAMEAVARSQ